MAAISNKSDAAMMAWYRAKKFGASRPPFEGHLPSHPGTTGNSPNASQPGPLLLRTRSISLC